MKATFMIEVVLLCSWIATLKFNILYLPASRAQQVPAVSQSAYSPSSSDTGDSMLANSPQTVLTKSLPPANIMGLPPTQPTTKVCKTECWLEKFAYLDFSMQNHCWNT